MEKQQLIEHSIIKKYRKQIWSKFIQAIKQFELIQENDKIAVCISGGKDSFLLAKCFQEIKKHKKISFELQFIIMDPGYSKQTLLNIKNNLKNLNIDAVIFNTNIFDIVQNDKSPCYKCAKMRRGYLYDKAQELGCNKIALGHNFDDVVETILLNQIYSGNYATMMPKIKSKNFIGMELIRPLYFIKESDIISWQKHNNLKFTNCACRILKKDNSQRNKMKQLIQYIDSLSPKGSKNIMTATKNVNLNRVLQYTNNKKTNFLDKY